MGRGKKKRIAKRRHDQKQRREIKIKMGKPIFFTLTHCSKKLAGFSDRYNYKSNMHKLIFKGAHFSNVRYQASIITKCNYNDTHLTGVDFFNSNLKSSSFKNACLKDVVFYNCNLNNVDFQGAKFSNVIFICTNISNAENFDTTASGYRIYRTYPQIDLEELEHDFMEFVKLDSIFKYKVLHVNSCKLNYWFLQIIIDEYGVSGLKKLVQQLKLRENRRHLFTVSSYRKLIEKC